MPASPLEVFEDNIADAERLTDLAAALVNTRVRRMRRELRDSVGDALGVRRGDRTPSIAWSRTRSLSC